MADPIKSPYSAKPGAAGSPVPGKESQMTADDFLASFNAPEMDAAETVAADGADAYSPLEIQQMQETSDTLGKGADLIGSGLDVAGRAADYGGGLVRTGLAGSAAALSGKEGVVGEEDIKAALKGKAPLSAEYLRRLGVPEGGKLGGITARGAAGFAADIATDPLTIVSKLVKEVPYIGKALNSTNMGTQALGEAVYKSAFRKVDEKLAEKGKGKLSELLIEQGAPTGGTEKIAQKVSDMTSTLGKLRQGLYDKATELGVSIDTSFPLKRAESVLQNMRKDPGLRPAADELGQLLERYKSEGKVSLDMMSEWKTSLYDALPASSYGPHGKLKGPAKHFKAALANDFRDAIVGAGNKAEKGLGDSIEAINNKFGILLNAAKPLNQSGRGTGSLGTAIEGAVLATGGIKAAAAKKAFEMAVSPGSRTIVGKALMEAGRKNLVEDSARRLFINATQGGSPLDLVPSGTPPPEETPTE